MKPFKFTLQALLILREQEEQTALTNYGQALLSRERAISAARSARDELTQAWGQFHDRLSAKCSAVELSQMKQWCQGLEQQLHELDTAAHIARAQAKEAFLKLLAARQARAVLEQLSAKQKKRHLRAKRKKEQKALDNTPARPNQLAALLELHHDTFWN